MKKEENSFYKNKIQPVLKQLRCRYDRIESRVGEGYPDVDFTYKGSNCKLELKVATGSRGKIAISSGQKNWHRKEAKAGGRSYILVWASEAREIYAFSIKELNKLDKNTYLDQIDKKILIKNFKEWVMDL